MLRQRSWVTGCLAAGIALTLCLVGMPGHARAAVQGAQSTASKAHKTESSYIIGPGDVLGIFVWQNPDLSEKAVPVRPDGRISTPLISSIMAAGKTPMQLAQDMDKVLSKYIRSPRVTVIVNKALGVLSEVQVIGQVAHPESLPYHEGMTVLDLVLAAGGLTPYAAGNDAKLERKVDGRVQVVRVRLSSLLNNGDLSQNLKIKPGDILVVPESFF
jgi:polysaccharide export outer membrane protein